jgi:SAM-dependent methyltransferase
MSSSHGDIYDAQRDVYDIVHAAIKDHRKEVQRLLKRVRGAIGRDPSSWLDVGCGTGLHLEALHEAGVPVLAGADNSAAQIDGARARLTGAPVALHLADMRDLDVERPDGGFDVVSCLFSCVGHLHDDADYVRALERMAAHMHRRGVVIVEPWIASEDFVPGRLDADIAETDSVKVVRVTKHAQDADTALLEFRFVVSRPGVADIADWTTELRLRLRSVDEQRAMFEQVFEQVEFHATGRGSRGVFLARRPRH